MFIMINICTFLLSALFSRCLFFHVTEKPNRWHWLSLKSDDYTPLPYYSSVFPSVFQRMTDELCGNSSWRKELPAGAVSRSDVSIWDVLKQAVGKVFLLFPKDVEFYISLFLSFKNFCLSNKIYFKIKFFKVLIKYIFWHEFSLWTMLPLNLVKFH